MRSPKSAQSSPWRWGRRDKGVSISPWMVLEVSHITITVQPCDFNKVRCFVMAANSASASRVSSFAEYQPEMQARP